jgi:hypothetical protein
MGNALPALLGAAIVALLGAGTAYADGMPLPVVPQPAQPLSVRYQRVSVSIGNRIAKIHVDQAFANDANRTHARGDGASHSPSGNAAAAPDQGGGDGARQRAPGVAAAAPGLWGSAPPVPRAGGLRLDRLRGHCCPTHQAAESSRRADRWPMRALSRPFPRRATSRCAPPPTLPAGRPSTRGLSATTTKQARRSHEQCGLVPPPVLLPLPCSAVSVSPWCASLRAVQSTFQLVILPFHPHWRQWRVAGPGVWRKSIGLKT